MNKRIVRAFAAVVTLTAGISAARAGDGVMPITTRTDASIGGTEDSKGGATNGMVSVDAFTGHVRSTFALALPPGRGGATPSLALSYASSGGTGMAGRGWSLSTPSIERRTLAGPPQFKDPQPGSPLDPATSDLFFGCGS
jgi:hypothetical protein